MRGSIALVFADTYGPGTPFGDTVDLMTAEAPPGSTSGPQPQDQVWSRTGGVYSAAGYTGMPHPQFQGEQGPQRPRGLAGVWTVAGLAGLLSVAAITVSVVKLAEPSPPSTTVTATPSPTAFSQQDIAKAKAESCEASKSASRAIVSATNALNAVSDRNSQEGQDALATAQTTILVELEYLELHTPPATPPEVANPTKEYIAAYRDLIDADTRGIDRSSAADRTRAAIDAIEAGCTA
ncbi:membrane protein [Mycobacteroides abscessus subsp. abscessus]|nr:membrane protein [Mycobacteroides abscessus subsp. abscessus]